MTPTVTPMDLMHAGIAVEELGAAGLLIGLVGLVLVFATRR